MKDGIMPDPPVEYLRNGKNHQMGRFLLAGFMYVRAGTPNITDLIRHDINVLHAIYCDCRCPKPFGDHMKPYCIIFYNFFNIFQYLKFLSFSYFFRKMSKILKSINYIIKEHIYH